MNNLYATASSPTHANPTHLSHPLSPICVSNRRDELDCMQCCPKPDVVGQEDKCCPMDSFFFPPSLAHLKDSQSCQDVEIKPITKEKGVDEDLAVLRHACRGAMWSCPAVVLTAFHLTAPFVLSPVLGCMLYGANFLSVGLMCKAYGQVLQKIPRMLKEDLKEIKLGWQAWRQSRGLGPSRDLLKPGNLQMTSKKAQ